jgi:hypothetical protein
MAELAHYEYLSRIIQTQKEKREHLVSRDSDNLYLPPPRIYYSTSIKAQMFTQSVLFYIFKVFSFIRKLQF